MVLALNAVLYLAAFSLSLCVVTPTPERAARSVRIAQTALTCGGGVAIAAAIALTFLGLWVESVVVGTIALVIVCVCLYVALSHSSSDRDDGEDGSDGGGGRPRRPIPPAPPKPTGPTLSWEDFDAVRAGWAREREPAGPRELVGA